MSPTSAQIIGTRSVSTINIERFFLTARGVVKFFYKYNPDTVKNICTILVIELNIINYKPSKTDGITRNSMKHDEIT